MRLLIAAVLVAGTAGAAPQKTNQAIPRERAANWLSDPVRGLSMNEVEQWDWDTVDSFADIRPTPAEMEKGE